MECPHNALKLSEYGGTWICQICDRPFLLRATGPRCALCGTPGGCVYIQGFYFDEYVHDKCAASFSAGVAELDLNREQGIAFFEGRRTAWQNAKRIPKGPDNPQATLNRAVARAANAALLEHEGQNNSGGYSQEDWELAWWALCDELKTYGDGQ